MISRRTLCLAIPLLMAGCATKIPDGYEFTAGHFSLSTWNKGKYDQVAGSYELLTNGSDIRLDLLTPIQTQFARIDANRWGAKLTQGKRVIEARNGDALMQQIFDVPMPFNTLYYWLKGQPDPDSPSTRKDADRFSQNGWDVQVRRRHASGLAETVSFTRNEENLRIRLLILVKEPVKGNVPLMTADDPSKKPEQE